MPSTISDLGEFDALVGAMGEPGRGVVEISSGPRTVAETEEIAGRPRPADFHGHRAGALQQAVPAAVIRPCSRGT
jgi:hypothetical protein